MASHRFFLAARLVLLFQLTASFAPGSARAIEELLLQVEEKRFPNLTTFGPHTAVIEVEGASNYFERSYSTGWFSSPILLDSRVDSNTLQRLTAARSRTHFPAFISAYTTAYPHEAVYYTVVWQPNADRVAWALLLNLDGPSFQAALHRYIPAGYKPQQVESYSFEVSAGIFYSAIFVSDSRWPASTKADVIFGVPYDSRYCCGPNSRWLTLQRQGYHPLSVSLSEDPKTKQLYIADAWNNAPSDVWQGGLSLTASQLSAALSSLPPNLSPIFIKAYRRTSETGYRQPLFAFIAASVPPGSQLPVSLTIDASRSAFELLAKVVTKPPIMVSVRMTDEQTCEVGPCGEVYTALWPV